MSVDENPGDDAPTPPAFADNVVPFRRERNSRAASSIGDESRDDDELLQLATNTIAKWSATSNPPSMTEVQNLLHELICNGGSAMLRDRVVATIVGTFGDDFGGRRALSKTWGDIARQVAAERSQPARGVRDGDNDKPLTAEQKTALRTELWSTIRELAEAPDLMNRVVKQVQSIGVVNEDELIALLYISGTSRVLQSPINPLVKGSSSAGKSYTTTRTLELIGPRFVNYLTSSSALSLVYDERPLSHTILVVFEATQLQADEHGMFAMLLRTLISEGKIVHQTTVDDPSSSTGRRVVRIEREGPISLIITATGELHPENETRMLSYRVTESQEQTRGVIKSLSVRASGASSPSSDLAPFHDLQRWIALGPNDAVIPFARQIAAGIPPSMVRFRRDVGSLFSFIKACAILHQAQRGIDSQGRVLASVVDYRVAYPIFTKVLAQSSGLMATENVRAVVELIAARADALTSHHSKSKFARAGAIEKSVGLEITSEQIGTATGIGKSAAHRAVRKAIDLGFLNNNEIRPGKAYRLVLKNCIDDVAPDLLPHPDSIVESVAGND
jgi:hypothetical protein